VSNRIDIDEYRDRIGTVEKHEIGRIRRLDAQRYARAVEDDNPLFHDPEYARDQGYDDVVVPPNYPPAIIERDEGVPANDLREDGIDREFFPIPLPDTATLMGGGQQLSIDRYIVAGERITAEREFSDLYQRNSEAMGTLTFMEFSSDFFASKDDERVLRCDETFIVGDRR
jgi:acyl dehydratase